MVKVPDIPENVRQCICPGCPTFRESKLKNTLFCARGRANEPVMQKGCDCPKCPVQKNYALKDMYYCSNGAAV